jgi:hypothetical protein
LPTYYYSGRVTAPISDPDRGSVVLVPRSKFEASASAVHHLVKAGLCKRLPDPPKKVEVPVAEVQLIAQAPAEAPVALEVEPPRLIKSEPEEKVSTSDENDEGVVASASSSSEEAATDQQQQKRSSGKRSRGGRSRKSD